MVTLRESAKMAELAGWLDSGEVDLVLVPAPVPDRLAVAAVTVAEEEIVLTAPTGHHLADQPTVRIADLDGAPLVHFAPDNGLSAWLDRSLAEAGVRPEPVMRTSVTTAAPQLAAAGLGVAVSPVSAVSPGFPGVVRSFSPRWVRRLVALRPTTSDPLTDRFVEDVRARGVGVPEDVRAQLTRNSEPSK
jgi:DNA-binding transcriptional LysR family regulator